MPVKLKLLIVVCFLGLIGCASTEEAPKGKYHPANDINDIFQVEQGMPMRELKEKQDFYFKRCSLAGRFPHITKIEYECNNTP